MVLLSSFINSLAVKKFCGPVFILILHLRVRRFVLRLSRGFRGISSQSAVYFTGYNYCNEHSAAVFHGPLDLLALLRVYIVPITGN